MTGGVKRAFEAETVAIAVEQILPSRLVTPETRKSPKYGSSRASDMEVGIIEPLVVHPQNGAKREPSYLLLDGHLRLDVLKELGARQATCLISTDDEGFTYNKQISRLTSVQEHYMILKAVEKGVPPDRIARALNVDVARIREKQNLLKDVASEVADLFKNRPVSPSVFPILRRMKPLRQVEVAELMIAANKFTVSYARALLAATAPDQLVDPKTPKKIKGMSAEDLARMEREMETLQRHYRPVEESFGTTMLNLVVAKGYVTKLLENPAVLRYLSQNHPELLSELQGIVDAIATNALRVAEA
jgi:hypothetical protein